MQATRLRSRRMALHPAAIRQVLKPFRVALTGGRSKMFIGDAAERSTPGSTLVSGEKRIKASKNPPFAPRNPNRKCPTRRNISLNCYNTVTQYLYGLLGVTSVAWVRPADYFGGPGCFFNGLQFKSVNSTIHRLKTSSSVDDHRRVRRRFEYAGFPPHPGHQ